MEAIEVENEFRLYEAKKGNLRKTRDKITSMANDILVFNLQWSDLEECLYSVEEKVEKRFKELVLKEIELLNKSNAIDERVKVVEAEVEEKQKELDILEGKSKEEEIRLVGLKKSVEECTVEEKSKRSQLSKIEESFRKTQAELDLKKVEEIRLSGLKKSVEELTVEEKSKRSQLSKTVESLKKTQGELGQIDTVLERHRVQVNAEKELLVKTQSRRTELDNEIEKMTKNLSSLKDKIEEYTVEEKSKRSQLSKTVESLRKTKAEIDLKGGQLAQMDTVLASHCVQVNAEKELFVKAQTRRTELENDIERMTKNLTSVRDKVKECDKLLELKGKQLEQMNIDYERRRGEISEDIKQRDKLRSYNKELELDRERKKKDVKAILGKIAECKKQHESVEEQLESKQKKLKELSMDLGVKEQTVKSINGEMEVTCKKLDDVEKMVQERSAYYESIKSLIEEHSEELASKEKLQIEKTEAIQKLSFQIADKEKTLEIVKAGLQQLAEELESTRKQHEEATAEFESKKKQCDQIQSSIANLTTQLNTLKKKNVDTLQEFKSKEEKLVRLKASLTQREEELGVKEKEFDAKSEKIELKEKDIDEREKMLEKENMKLAKCVKAYELKTKALQSFCQQKSLVEDANVRDEKTMQLILQGHLKKRQQLHLDIMRDLKAYSDPEKLVLSTLQGIYSACQRMEVTNVDMNIVRRNNICLLECLMDMSPKPSKEVQREAFKFATEWKNATQIKEDNPVEVLGLLHFLAAFSLSYTFDADKAAENLFDVAFLRKFAPSLCKALGVSALAPVNNIPLLDVKPEYQICESPINKLTDHLVSASLSPDEVSRTLQNMEDPSSFVINFIDQALKGALQRGELGLAESIVKTLVAVLEELPRVVRSSDRLLKEATQVAQQWSQIMGNRGRTSPLEAWGFLHLIVAYGLVDSTKQEPTLHFASFVTGFKQAPKLYQSLGLTCHIPSVVKRLIGERKYISAIRFIFFFDLKNMFPPIDCLKEEINSLKRYVRFESEAEDDRAAGKMRDIIELIQDFKMDIDLPVELIVKFMTPNGNLKQNQSDVLSTVLIQPLQIMLAANTQASQMTVVASHGSNSSFTTRPPPNQAQSSHQAVGYKRPRVDSRVPPRPVIRHCSNPSGYSNRS